MAAYWALDVHFEGYFLCRLTTDPDPTDEPRGVSGYTLALAGETNLDNCVLLCKRHHRMVHEGGWQLIKTPEGEIVSIAPTITFGLPRGPDQPKE